MQICSYLGCPKQGDYGENCALSCSSNCVDGVCHIVYGTCFGCRMGYKGAMCNESLFLSIIKIQHIPFRCMILANSNKSLVMRALTRSLHYPHS